MCAHTRKCTFDAESAYADLAAEVFTLLSDATRVRIILALRDGELPVGELAERVGKSPTVVSQHLAKLRWGKIVETRKEGNRVFYSLLDEHARQLVSHAVFQAEHVVDGIPVHHLGADGLPIAGDALEASAPQPAPGSPSSSPARWR
ncbi:MAG: metalloregulator ArsR/SmtB family transcription factor [Acidipropionibacterium acidipropionici]|nr:metalloregulator ArsR/SmtB family transcription factor [Acidipropionibacterium acidipropionici]